MESQQEKRAVRYMILGRDGRKGEFKMTMRPRQRRQAKTCERSVANHPSDGSGQAQQSMGLQATY